MKVIRISGLSYYKLVELDGLFTVLFGSQSIPLSTIADMIITAYYDAAYGKLKEVIMDPDKLQTARKELGGNLKRLIEAWTKPKFE